MRVWWGFLLLVCTLARAVPLHDFETESGWKQHPDGGVEVRFQLDSTLVKEGEKALHLFYKDAPPHWGNLVGSCFVPANAVALRLRTVSRHEVILQPGETKTLVATVDTGKLQGDFHPVWAELWLDGKPMDTIESAFCLRDEVVLSDEELQAQREWNRFWAHTTPISPICTTTVPCMTVPTRDGGRLIVLVRADEEREKSRVTLPAHKVSLFLKPMGCAFVLVSRKGEVLAAESEGELQLDEKVIANAEGHYALVSLDRQGLVRSRRILVLPHQQREVSLYLHPLGRVAVSTLAKVSSARMERRTSPVIRFGIGEVAIAGAL